MGRFGFARAKTKGAMPVRMLKHKIAFTVALLVIATWCARTSADDRQAPDAASKDDAVLENADVPRDEAATRPASDAWTATVDQLARAIVAGDAQSLAPILADGLSVRSFGGKDQTMIQLLSQGSKAILVTARGAEFPPAAMAASLDADIRSSPVVPDDLKRKMSLGDEAQARHANEIAAQWIGQQTGAKLGDPVGVIMLLIPDAEQDPRQAATPITMQPCFLLIRGQPHGSASAGRVSAIVFGNPTDR